MATENLFDLTGQRVLISGAGGGIGSAAARACAALGAELILTDIRPIGEFAEELSAAGVVCSHHIVDNTKFEQVEALAAKVDRLDALAECSGAYISGDWKNGEEWNDLAYRLFGLNVIGPVNLIRAFLPVIAQSGGGRIAVLGSISGRSGGSSPEAEPAYVASKGAVHSLIRYFSRYAGPLNVVVNGLAPGPVLTPMLAGSALDFDMSRFPLGRLATPDEVGAPVAFLCSRAAGHMSGVVLDINGGTTFS